MLISDLFLSYYLQNCPVDLADSGMPTEWTFQGMVLFEFFLFSFRMYVSESRSTQLTVQSEQPIYLIPVGRLGIIGW